MEYSNDINFLNTTDETLAILSNQYLQEKIIQGLKEISSNQYEEHQLINP